MTTCRRAKYNGGVRPEKRMAGSERGIVCLLVGCGTFVACRLHCHDYLHHHQETTLKRDYYDREYPHCATQRKSEGSKD